MVQVVKKSIFEVHESNTTGPLDPPKGVYYVNLPFLRENIDSHELGDSFYAILASSQAILGPK